MIVVSTLAEPLRSAFPRRAADITMAGALVVMVGMMIVPLPPFLLDLLIVANVATSLVILLVALNVPGSRQLTAFPTVLLLTTLYRLALNVSSTRLILLQADAGDVIQAFGHFVVRGNYVVGAVIFLILTLIQFIVVAKGSERVAEVGARFTLDAMPGKQMSIDAELRTGSVDQEQARQQRRALQRDSEFYGAMDGAMKFVKGDAIAGMVITVVNIAGGLAIGIAMRDLSAAAALKTYGLLTIGDGLVSQIPALLISTSAGLVVTRVASEEAPSLGTQIAQQIFGDPKPLFVASGFLAALAAVPGLPAIPFLVLACSLLAFGWAYARVQSQTSSPADPSGNQARAADSLRVPNVVPVAVEVGPDLAERIAREEPPWVSSEVATVRDRLFAELGVPFPPVEVLSSTGLTPDAYRFWVHETEAEHGEIDPSQTELTELAARLASVLRRRAPEFVGLQDVQGLLDHLEESHPAAVRNVVPKPITLALLTEILRRLVQEEVSIRPLPEILGALSAAAPQERDPVALTEVVRSALRRQITQRYLVDGNLTAHLLDPAIEEAIRDAIQHNKAGSYLALPPDLAREIIEAIRNSQPGDGRTIVITQTDIRRFVRRLVEAQLPRVTVLSFQELPPEITVFPLARIEL